MTVMKTLLGGALLALGLLGQPVTAAEKAEPIHFGDITWESGSLITEILRTIVEQGYGYPTDTLPGSTVSLEVALAKNDIQVIGEEWAGRSPFWVKAEAEGKVFGLGDTVKGATEGWWVPEYVIKGDPERGLAPLAPELKSVADLARYKDVFRDPESPNQGRFLNSPTGWTSEIVNSQKLKAYGLSDSYVNFRTGSAAALDAEVAAAIRRGKPVLFYYWSPTPLLGRYKLVHLEEPPFDAEAWKTLSDPNNANPKGSRSLPARLAIGVSAPFHARYPELVAFFEKVDLPIDLLNQTLAHMAEKRLEPRTVAQAFLREQPQVWTAWVPAEVASNVNRSLK
ncbi:ABC transporter substrate-binding protein [Pseudomonas putida]|uniref:ABC transporter substrate-binding protein n=2 Tax=Pseudomonas putida group TaxID=136845 RepID=A0A7W2L3W0_PSEPU|nr:MULTISPECIES: ABC transporter substrate-binding protein [Pseudomonas]MBA6118009.1 ABC transporter substrate-binding protein [Pseudomonas putida]MBI6941588.1 ABC transporter substrate-binding protein [Pseudomonas putida]MBI6957847.1 ABC transporter substrate-binding protein [Pseudomonas putida]MCZ9635769.1 ABC transporter substrate-binding protein [Pseudomonas putida]MEC4879134.1 ABC transporter substrate-binding protein [Pseudomonas sp. NC26]